MNGISKMFCRSIVEMVIMDPEDLDIEETRAIGWILLVLAMEMEIANLL